MSRVKGIRLFLQLKQQNVWLIQTYKKLITKLPCEKSFQYDKNVFIKNWNNVSYGKNVYRMIFRNVSVGDEHEQV